MSCFVTLRIYKETDNSLDFLLESSHLASIDHAPPEVRQQVQEFGCSLQGRISSLALSSRPCHRDRQIKQSGPCDKHRLSWAFSFINMIPIRAIRQQSCRAHHRCSSEIIRQWHQTRTRQHATGAKYRFGQAVSHTLPELSPISSSTS